LKGPVLFGGVLSGYLFKFLQLKLFHYYSPLLQELVKTFSMRGLGDEHPDTIKENGYNSKMSSGHQQEFEVTL
jgi:hypothetical protein